MRRTSLAPAFVASLWLAGSGSGASPAAPAGRQEHAVPAPLGSMAPAWAVSSKGRLILSFLEPSGDEYRLRAVELSGGQARELGEIARSSAMFANWADTPGLAEAPDGTLWAHWLEKNGADTYAYGIALARSKDGGRTWQRQGFLNDDDVAAEHGFVSWSADATGLHAFWLDGRGTPAGGPMTLRTARVGDRVAPSQVVDPRVCDCCQTAVAATAGGLLVAFRDRSEDEIRDIAISRHAGGAWSPARVLGQDGWKIPGCPVNGPAVAARGDLVAVAWFTGADRRPRVQIAFSGNGGVSFGQPVKVDDREPSGRIGLALTPEGKALVSWLGAAEAAAELRLASIDPAGKVGTVLALGRTTAGRASGVPRLAVAGGRAWLAWVEAGADKAKARLRVTSVPLSAIP
ncbi:MAG TPA: sialidase family protein [Thermoanaerobaculia bacterium]|nr:sialidase family protein [Thermoanaerobaculia bacterium]